MADVPQRIWHHRLNIRDTGIYEDGGRRIYTTAGVGYEKRPYILATPEALASQPEVQALIRAAKVEGMREAADILMRDFGVPLRPVDAWSDAEKKAYEIGQREASQVWQEMILREADKIHKDPMLITHGCCCTGPARGETKCPCKLLWDRVKRGA